MLPSSPGALPPRRHWQRDPPDPAASPGAPRLPLPRTSCCLALRVSFLPASDSSPPWQRMRQGKIGTGKEDGPSTPLRSPPSAGCRGKALPRLRRLLVCDLTEPLFSFSSYPSHFPSPASAFSSQTHRFSPINPPRCSRGDAKLLPPRLLLNQHAQIRLTPGRGVRGGSTPVRCTSTASRCAALSVPPPDGHRTGGSRDRGRWIFGGGAKAGQQRPVRWGDTLDVPGGWQALWHGGEWHCLPGWVPRGDEGCVEYMPGETFLVTVMCFSRLSFRKRIEKLILFLLCKLPDDLDPLACLRKPFYCNFVNEGVSRSLS